MTLWQTSGDELDDLDEPQAWPNRLRPRPAFTPTIRRCPDQPPLTGYAQLVADRAGSLGYPLRYRDEQALLQRRNGERYWLTFDFSLDTPRAAEPIRLVIDMTKANRQPPYQQELLAVHYGVVVCHIGPDEITYLRQSPDVLGYWVHDTAVAQAALTPKRQPQLVR